MSKRLVSKKSSVSFVVSLFSIGLALVGFSFYGMVVADVLVDPTFVTNSQQAFLLFGSLLILGSISLYFLFIRS